MPGLISRSLSLAVTAAAELHLLRQNLASWYVVLILAPALALIWFAEQIDDLTFGTWHQGNRIDTHTPPVMIAAMGWILLAVEAFVLFRLRWVNGQLGM